MDIFANFRNPDDDAYLIFLKEKYKDKPFTFWYDKFPENPSQLSVNPYNFLFLHEPDEFFGMHSNASRIAHNFSAVLTWNENLLNIAPNAINFTYNGQTLDEDYILTPKEKEFNVSFICGTKELVEGHKLRHKVYNLESRINVPKKWYYVLEDFDHKTGVRPGYGNYTKDLSHIPEGVDIIGYGRRALFNDSMFNVVIENVKHNNWYNKIGDNFLTKTLPIYWGCPNISEFGYDERGIIRFNTEEELLDILNNLSPQDYFSRLEFIEHNYNLALVDTFENNISQFIDQFFELNSL